MPVHLSFLKSLLLLLLGLMFHAGLCTPSPELSPAGKQLRESLKKRDWSSASELSYTLAGQYWQQRDAREALNYLEQCLLYSKRADHSLRMQQAYQHMGLIYAETNNLPKSLNHYEKGLKLARENGLMAAEQECLLQIARGHQELGNYRKSLAPLEELLSLALRQKDLPLQEKAYTLLAESYRQLGKEDIVREYLSLLELVQDQQQDKQTEKQLIQTKSSLLKTETSLQQATALNDLRQLEIDLLSKEKEVAELYIREQHARLEYTALIRNASIGGLLMALGLITVMVRSHRRNRVANLKIEKQNKNISSSINYARRIQEAMLPSAAQHKNLLPDSFVLFRPRDSVSGDFYLLKELKNSKGSSVVLAAADCTGHGVPGAFMSLIGMNALTGIISRGISQTHEVLNALDEEIRTALQQETSGNNDGMDIALCIYHKKKNLLEFSGAKNPLVYIREGALFQIKGDIHTIGGRSGKKERKFQQHLLSIDKPTTLYLFSDGFRDQFGEHDKGKFMSRRFNQLLLDIHQLPLTEQEQILKSTFEEWKGTAPQTDDVLVIGLKLQPQDLGIGLK